MNEQMFEVVGKDGLCRRGVLTLPSQPATAAVVLLPAGLKYRVGPHRVNVALARRVAQAGYLVLRFDPLGMGESDGSLPALPTHELWTLVAKGRFVEDSLLACKEIRQRFGVTQVVLGGMCGGALTAQLAAAQAPELINGIVSVGTAVTMPSAEPIAAVSEELARKHTRSYLKKLISKEAWARMFRGDTDFQGMLKILITAARSAALGSRVRDADSTLPNENPLFMESFRKLQGLGINHLLLFGTGDNRWLEFESGVLKTRLHGQRDGRGYEIRLIPDANHELHFALWQEGALQEIEGWLRKHYCGSPIVMGTAVPQPVG